jgi:peptidoglycan/LPS O-acetylase OafA/YrhL
MWSLGVEKQFYMLWPPVLVLVLVRRYPHRRRAVLGGLAVVSPIVLAVVGCLTNVNYVLLSGHLPAITIGCLAADLFTFGIPKWMDGLVRSSLGSVAGAGCPGALFATYNPLLALPPACWS